MLNVQKIIALFLVLLVTGSYGWSQEVYSTSGANAITSAVPFLSIAPDSRGGAMGDAGVATSPDVNSQHWNSSKYAFVDGEAGVSVSYIPWLRELVGDMNIAYLSGYYRLDDQQVFSGSMRFFTYGDINLTDASGAPLSSVSPNELALDFGYSLKLSDNWSGGVVGRYIRSDFGISGDYQAANAVAADVSFYYQNGWKQRGQRNQIAWGVNLSNIGTKVSYDGGNTKDFLPMNFRTGVAYSVEPDKYNKFTVTVDMNKLLVPTPDTTITAQNGSSYGSGLGNAADQSVVGSIFKSWTDAPGGFEEELQEIAWSLGAEYWYNKQFALRAGYFYENPNKGNRQYMTVGAGLQMNVFGLDFSYMIPTATNNNALGNTLRFSLLFDFEAFSKQGRRRR